MRLCAIRTNLHYSCLFLAIVLMTLGCSTFGSRATPTPTAPESTRVRVSVINPTATPTEAAPQVTTPTSDSTPTSTPLPLETPASTIAAISLSLSLLAPAEGADVEVGAVRVLGVTSPNAAVQVNGVETEVTPQGTFQQDLILQEGINSIEAVATGSLGDVATDYVVVLFVPRPEGIPLSVLFPQGFEVSQPEITIIGATRQDAVVGVNGIPVDVNSLGIFSTEVALEEGANLVEVVAVDLEENVNFQTVVVFYIP